MISEPAINLLKSKQTKKKKTGTKSQQKIRAKIFLRLRSLLWLQQLAPRGQQSIQKRIIANNTEQNRIYFYVKKCTYGKVKEQIAYRVTAPHFNKAKKLHQ